MDTHPEFIPYSGVLGDLREALACFEVRAGRQKEMNVKWMTACVSHRFLMAKLELHLAIVSSCRGCFNYITIHSNHHNSLQQCHNTLIFTFTPPFIPPPALNPFLSLPLFIHKSSSSHVAGRGGREGRRGGGRETSLVESNQVLILIIISTTQC